MTAATLRFAVVVQPGARADRIAGPHGDALRVQVRARPVDGAANAAVVHLLAAALGVPRQAVRIAAGASGRRKLVSVACEGPGSECARRLAALQQGVAVDNGGGRA